GLDYRETLAMLQLLEAYRAAGGTLLIITHDMDMATRFARRIVVMAHGRIVHDVPAHAAPAYFGALHDAALILPEVVGLTRQLGLPSTLAEVPAAAHRPAAGPMMGN